MEPDLIRLFLRMVRKLAYSPSGGYMSSHREAPAISSLSAFVGLPTLASVQVGITSAFNALEQVDQGAVRDWHVNLNITDFYVFQKLGDAHKTILIMNVNPMPPRLADSFDPAAIYEFRVDTNGDAVADIAFRVTFSAYESGQQRATIRRATGQQAASNENSGEVIIANAPVSFSEQAQVTNAGDYAFFAGVRSDPFFFDLMGFCNNLKFTGTDYFADKDVFGIVLEVPDSALGGQSKAGFWSRVLWSHDGEWLPVARLGLPLVNILFNAPADKDVFNRSEPHEQEAVFMQKVVAQLESMGQTASRAQEIARMFIPDILQYDSSSSQGFFNGRRLADDVVDIILNLVTAGKVTTDMVGPHHDYLSEFPYLGQPNGR
jgi:hypothetical protein